MAVPTAEELNDLLYTIASNPKEVEVDGTSVVAHSLKFVVDAIKHLQTNAAVSTPQRGIRITKLSPPGALE